MTNKTTMPVRVPQHLIDRLHRHCEDKSNSAFARSTMREALQYLTTDPVKVQTRQWQPIETAPKDFVTEFDGWNGKRVPNVIWAHPEYEAKGEYAWCRPFYEPNHGWTMERVRGLTHWMPLPAPPLDAAME